MTPTPVDSNVTTNEARKHFSSIVDRAAFEKERVILSRRGKPVAAVVPLEDVELLEQLEIQADLKAVREAEEEIGQKGTIPLDEVLEEFGVKR